MGPLQQQHVGLVMLLSCLVISQVQGTRLLPQSVLHLFGQDAGVAIDGKESCGPEVTIETPACKVVEKGNGYELRNYPDGEIWVETLVDNSTFESATFTGFYRCFYFISGKNSKGMKIEMTGPVHIIPVPESKGYKIAFFVPSRFKSINDLPIPSDPKVKFHQPKGAVKAVIGPFGGFPTGSDYEAKFSELKNVLEKDGVKYDKASVVYAGYSSPFEFRNRKQEVHVNIVV